MIDFTKLRPLDRQLYIATQVAAGYAAGLGQKLPEVLEPLGVKILADNAWAVAKELNRRYVAACGGEG